MKAKVRVLLLCVILSILAAPTYPSSISTQNRTPDGEGNNPGTATQLLDNGDDEPLILSEIPSSTSGAGTLLDVTEYVNGTFSGRRARANESSTFYSTSFDLPSGWSASQVTAISSQMYHVVDWVSNGDFSLGNSTTPEDWADYVDHTEANPTYDSINDWILITRASGGKVGYDYWGSWNQTLSVNEGDAVHALLNVSYRITTTTGTNGQNALPYVYVNGTVWELPTGGKRFSVNQEWQVFSLELDPDSFDFPGVLTVAFGIRGFADTQFQTTGVLYCDNVSLTLETSRLPEAVSLMARDANEQLNTQDFITGALGKGYATLFGDWTNQVSLEFIANESGTEFTLELFVPLTQDVTLDSNSYQISNGTDATWESRFFVEEMGDPFTYYYFNVSIPEDWTLVQILDGFDVVQLSGASYYNASFYSGDSVLKCSVAGTGVVGTPHYGTWKISSVSPNYGKTTSFWAGSGSSWTQTDTFYPLSNLRVNVTFQDELNNGPMSPGIADIEFYDSEGAPVFSEAGETVDSNGIVTFQNGTGSSNITILSSWLPGTITALASWSNGTAVGEIRRELYIYHRTTIEVESSIYQAFRGDSVSVRVRYIDLETNLGISGATLYFSWVYGSGSMGYAGGGYYAGAVDTSLAEIGSYLITTNASKAFYDFADVTFITLEVQERTQLLVHEGSRIDRTSFDVAWGDSNMFYLSYDDIIAMNPSNLTADIGTLSNPDVTDTYTSNNQYAVIDSVANSISLIIEVNATSYDLNVSDLASLTYKFEGRFDADGVAGSVSVYDFSASNWEVAISTYSDSSDTTRSWRSLSLANFISTSGIVRARVDASFTSAFSYYLDMFDFIAARPINDSTPGISLTGDWTVQSGGAQIGPSFNSSLSQWQIQISTVGVSPGEYSLTLEASASGHQLQSRQITIRVGSHFLRIIPDTPSETAWSENTWVNFSIEDGIDDLLVISESNISRVEMSSVFGIEIFTSTNWTYDSSSGLASIGFWVDTTTWDVGSYDVTISLYTSGAGVSKYFADAEGHVPIVIRLIRTSLSTDRQVILVNWSESFHLNVSYTQIGGSQAPVSGATVNASLGGIDFVLTFNGTTYNGIVDTSQVSVGTYILTVSADRLGYEPGIAQVTVAVYILETTLVSSDGMYSYDIMSGDLIELTVFYEADAFDIGVSGASVTYSWDHGSGLLFSNGTAGFYTVTIDTSGTFTNIYTIYIRANKSNYAAAAIYISLVVDVVETDLTVVGEGVWQVVYGENIDVNVTYTTAIGSQPITGALVTFRFGETNYTGTLNETAPGTYGGVLDTSGLDASSLSVYVVASNPGYETGSLTLLLIVSKVETVLSPLNTTLSIVYEEETTFYFRYHDIYNDVEVENATLQYGWLGGTGFLQSIGGGLFILQLDSLMVGPGVYDVLVTASKPNHMTRSTSVTLEILRIGTDIIANTTFEVAIGDSLSIHLYFNDTSFGKPITDASGSMNWIFGSIAANSMANGNYSIEVPDTIPLGAYSATIILSKTNYSTASIPITIIVREIRTQLSIVDGNDYIVVVVGNRVDITLRYMDLDHNVPIAGATITLTQATGIIDQDDYTVVEDATPGQYVISFFVLTDEEFRIQIYAQNGTNYVVQDIEIVIIGSTPPSDPLLNLLTLGGSIGVIFLLLGALLYVRVFSVPKIVRILNRMIKKLAKGAIPEAPEMMMRDKLLHIIINENLDPIGIQKPLEEIPAFTIEIELPELDNLLEELASITGLEEEDINVLRTDLARMRASERPGFLLEVIKQERARRAQDISEEKEEVKAAERVTEEELEDIRKKLEKLGIAPDEIDVIIENARELTRAEIDALLDSFDV